MTVAQYLAQSIAAHTRYRRAAPSRDVLVIGAALTEAAARRADALAADPARADPAWAVHERSYPHEALMAFYAEQLSR